MTAVNVESTPQVVVPYIRSSRTSLRARAVAATKRTVHTERGRPVTTVEVRMPADKAGLLLAGLRKCSCDGATAVLTFLPLPRPPTRSRLE